MLLTGQAVLFALFVWYFSTGVILYLDGLPVRTFRWSILGASVVAVAALCEMSAVRDDLSMSGAYAAFGCGVLAWAWQEMAFLMGFATGPRRQGCSQTGWPHFANAVQAVLHHEVAILAGAVLVAAAAWGGANKVGVWTYMILWGMRQSAKLNVFLGVRNLNLEFLPEHLAFLKSYLHCKPMNLLFPLSITGGTVLAAVLVQQAAAAPATSTGLIFFATMTILGLVEHWFLVLPVPFARLWDWGLGSRRSGLHRPESRRPGLHRAVLPMAEPPGAVQSQAAH